MQICRTLLPPTVWQTVGRGWRRQMGGEGGRGKGKRRKSRGKVEEGGGRSCFRNEFVTQRLSRGGRRSSTSRSPATASQHARAATASEASSCSRPWQADGAERES
eukprot:762715-Hanusia_phi.AAC.7